MSIKSVLQGIKPLVQLKHALAQQHWRLRRHLRFGQTTGPTVTEEMWKTVLPSEANFWRSAMSDGVYRERLSPERPFPEELRTIILGSASGAVSHLRILDLGAGPLTTLGPRWEGKQLEIVAVDPLAADYDQMLADLHLTPPVRTIVGTGEALLTQFGEAAFDFAHSSNALDHAYDPLLSIKNMVLAVKPGCFVYLFHFENEGEKENFNGLHQWNFFCRKGDMIISTRDREFSLTETLKGLGEVRCHSTIEHNGVVITTIRRFEAQTVRA